jgi:uncharacterized membrane protein
MMKALVEFLKTTLIGGLLIVVPVYLTVLLLTKALKGMVALLGPIVALLPERVHHLRQFIAIALVVLVWFMLGLIARTGVGRRVIDVFERRVLERMPGFAMLRSVVRRVSGTAEDAQFQPVLVQTDEETLTPGFIVEELDGDRLVVLVPSVPTPAAGSLYILPRKRVHWVDAPVTEAIGVITRWGAARASSSKRCAESAAAVGSRTSGRDSQT